MGVDRDRPADAGKYCRAAGDAAAGHREYDRFLCEVAVLAAPDWQGNAAQVPIRGRTSSHRAGLSCGYP